MTMDTEKIEVPSSIAARITDLRSALEFLKQFPEDMWKPNEPVDPMAELSGVYRYVGAWGHCDAADADRSGHGVQQG